MPTLCCENHSAQQMPVSRCVCLLPERGMAVFRIRPETEKLLPEKRNRPHRNHATATCPARVRRPEYFVERRRSDQEAMDLLACPKLRACLRSLPTAITGTGGSFSILLSALYPKRNQHSVWTDAKHRLAVYSACFTVATPGNEETKP